jgi:hypothetical protein
MLNVSFADMRPETAVSVSNRGVGRKGIRGEVGGR